MVEQIGICRSERRREGGGTGSDRKAPQIPIFRTKKVQRRPLPTLYSSLLNYISTKTIHHILQVSLQAPLKWKRLLQAPRLRPHN